MCLRACAAPCTVMFLWSAAIFFMCHCCLGLIHHHHSCLFFPQNALFNFTMLNHHNDHLCHHPSSSSSPPSFPVCKQEMCCASTEEYLSLLVLSEFSWTPVLTTTEQPDQPFQFPQPGTWRGLRNRVCRWWEQHFWGQLESEGLFVSSQESWSTRQQHEPVQHLVASSASNHWDQAQLYRQQWGCFSGGG